MKVICMPKLQNIEVNYIYIVCCQTEAVAATVTATFSTLWHSSRRPLLEI